MKIYVVINSDHEPEIAFQDWQTAEDYCRKVVEDGGEYNYEDEWDCYYTIREVFFDG